LVFRVRDDEETKPRGNARRPDASSTLTKRVAVKNLGRLAPIDSTRLEPGLVLWDRFCVIEKPRETDGQLIVAVTDLERDPERVFGDALEPRLELHQIPAPSEAERPRWLRGLSVNSRVQAQVYAHANVGEEFIALLCEPTLGTPVTQTAANGELAPLALDGRALLVFAHELAGLLAALHQSGAHGVRFDLQRLRVKDGHYHVDGFSHLQLEDEGRDLESLMALIERVGGEATTPLLEPPPTSVLDLWRRLRSRDGAEDIRHLPSEPLFVGREDALSALRHGFEQAQIAKTTIIIVQGPLGSGKSRLLREFAAQRLQADDSLVLAGAWERDSANVRSGLIGALDLLPRVLSRLNEDERDDMRMRINYATRGVGAVVARSAPSLQTVLRRVEDLPPLDLGEDFTRHTATISELFRSLGTSKRPLVVILDNLENADASSIAMLNILAEAQPAHHTLVLLGFRTGGERSRPALEAKDIELSLLEVREVVDLLRKTLPGTVEDIEAVAERLWSGSQGLPLAIWAGLRTWLDRGYLSRNGGDGVWRVQASAKDAQEETGVRSLFGPRMVGLSPAVREFALHAALLGAKLSDDEVLYLCALLDMGPDDATHDLLRLGILIQGPGGVRFPQSSIREFVLESFGEAERRAGHERIAQLLVERQAPIAQIAYHRDLAFDPNTSDPAASNRLSRLHVEAGRERLSVYDLERARWHLEQALVYSHDSDQRAIAAEGLADVCLLLKDLDTAVSLYTAIIATSDGLQSLQVAGKVSQFLFFQSAFKSGRALGAMAFEQVNEPTPQSRLGNLGLILSSRIRSWFGPPKIDDDKRDAIVRIHLWVAQMCFVDDPLALLAHVARGSWVGQNLETSPAAMLMSFEAFLWGAVAGRYDYGNELFKRSLEIATVKVKDFWAEAYIRHNWAIHLLSSNNYEKGQDMADDAIGAFREAGDVSPTSVTLMFKGLYGRDHEPAEKLLRWFDEAISASRRNGKTLCLVPLQCLKLHILARQNPDETKLQLADAAVMTDCEETAAERLVARTHLTFACYECAEWEFGKEQILKAIADITDGPGVPEFCQDFYLAAAFVLMDLPNPTRADRKLLGSMLAKFRRFAKRSPRLGGYNDLLNLKLAIKARDSHEIQAIASKIIAEVDVHENLYMAHHAHRALSNSLKGHKVFEAAEHERMAREYGRHIGISDFTLSAFMEVQDELAERGFRAESRLKEPFEVVGMLGAAPLESSLKSANPGSGSGARSRAQSDVITVWALNQPTQTSLGEILEPVRGAASNSIRADKLELSCSDPDVKVQLESSALQVLVINMLLACRDTLDIDATFSAHLEEGRLEHGSSVGQLKDIEPGRYLTVRVSARGAVLQNSMIAGYTSCEHLVSNLGGQLTASTDKVSATLTALIPLAVEADEANVLQQLSACVIVHPDAAVRESLGVALDDVGAPWRAFEPHEFGPASIEQARVILAHSRALDDLVVLGPLLNATLVEIVAEGEEPDYYDHEPLQLPATAARLKELLRSS
jgi:hypothetical protein